MIARRVSVIARAASVIALLALALPAGADWTWKPLRVGAGGWLTGISIANDGTRVVRADTYGAYIWDSGDARWEQLVTTSSMPSGDVTPDNAFGAYEIVIAPSDSNRIYMAWDGRVYKSTDRGATFTQTAFTEVPMEPNDGNRSWGGKAAVHPTDPDIVYVGTQHDGLWVTSDGGTSWALVADVPEGDERTVGPGEGFPGITGIAIDSTGKVYACSEGNGVYRLSGGTWSLLSGGPTDCSDGTISSTDVYWTASRDAISGNPAGVWRYNGSWTEVGPAGAGRYWHSVAVNPADPTHVVISDDGGLIQVSRDSGATWDAIIHAVSVTLSSPEIPWLSFTEHDFLSNGGTFFDPTQTRKLYFAMGTGVLDTTISASVQTTVTWTDHSVGIEQLVANDIYVPSGGDPILASWDRPLFRMPNLDVSPSVHGPTSQFNHGWAVTSPATGGSSKLIAIVSGAGGFGRTDMQSATSDDGGTTWDDFTSIPLSSTDSWNTFGFGTIAASTALSWIWVPSITSGGSGRAPYRTTDGGATWSKVTLQGVSDDATLETGWGWLHYAYSYRRHIVTADTVNPGTYYLWHSQVGLFRSTDYGANWTLMEAAGASFGSYSSSITRFHASLQAVPGRAGHLYLTFGDVGGSVFGSFFKSTDGGDTWSTVSNVLEVKAFGFGRGRGCGSGGYPAIFIAGWVSDVYGIWVSYDQASSWVKIGDYPMGNFDEPAAVSGDPDQRGIVYVGYRGSGYAYGRQGGACRPQAS